MATAAVLKVDVVANVSGLVAASEQAKGAIERIQKAADTAEFGKFKRDMAEGARVAAEFRTPLEVLEQRLSRIRQLYEAGAISAETWKRAVSAAQLQRAAIIDEPDRAVREQAQRAARERAAKQDTEAFANFRREARAGEAVILSLQTPLAQYAARTAELAALHRAGAISAEQYALAQRQAGQAVLAASSSAAAASEAQALAGRGGGLAGALGPHSGLGLVGRIARGAGPALGLSLAVGALSNMLQGLAKVNDEFRKGEQTNEDWQRSLFQSIPIVGSLQRGLEALGDLTWNASLKQQIADNEKWQATLQKRLDYQNQEKEKRKEAAEAAAAQHKPVTDLIDALKKENDATWMGEDAIKYYEASVAGATREELNMISALQESNAAAKKAAEARQQRADEYKANRQEIQQTIQAMRDEAEAIGLTADEAERLKFARKPDVTAGDLANYDAAVAERKRKESEKFAKDAAAEYDAAFAALKWDIMNPLVSGWGVNNSRPPGFAAALTTGSTEAYSALAKSQAEARGTQEQTIKDQLAIQKMIGKNVVDIARRTTTTGVTVIASL